MKHLLVASSVIALALGGAALAQNSMSGSQSQMQPTAPGTAAGANGPSNKSSATMSGMSGRAQSSQNLTSTKVQQAQTALKQQGLYKGQIDGKFGPQTRAAVSQFQKKNGLPQTAALNEQTLNDLNHGGSSQSSPSDNAGSSAGATPSAGPANTGSAAPGNSIAPDIAVPNSNNGAQSH